VLHGDDAADAADGRVTCTRPNWLTILSRRRVMSCCVQRAVAEAASALLTLSVASPSCYWLSAVEQWHRHLPQSPPLPGITAAAGSVHEGRDDRDGERGLELTRNTRLADVNEIKQQIRAATFETKPRDVFDASG